MSRVPELGELLAGRYRIQALAREGPGYLTLQAFDRDVEVEVSILWFRPGLFPTEEARQGFLGDAVTIRGLTHRHLRRVYEAHVYEENAFATAQVGSPAAVIKRLGAKRPADELDVIRYATAIGDGLEAAHRLGHVHGYLVPSDIVEVSGQVKLSGVGLYRAASRDVARDLFWTRQRYLAPEVLGGGGAAVTSDVYSMAAVLAELASGVSGGDISEALAGMETAHPRIRDVLAMALSASPEDRQPTVGAVLGELRKQLVDDRVPTAKQPAMKPPDDLQAPLLESDTNQAIVIEAEEPPESIARRQATTSRPKLTKQILSQERFDPNPISLLHADGDPMAVPADSASPAKKIGGLPPGIRPGSATPFDAALSNNDVGDMTVKIDFESKTKEYHLSDSLAAASMRDVDDDDDHDDDQTIASAEPEKLAAQDHRFSGAPASVEIAAPPDPFGTEPPRPGTASTPKPASSLDQSPATLRAMPPPPSRPAPVGPGPIAGSAPPRGAARPSASQQAPSPQPLSPRLPAPSSMPAETVQGHQRAQSGRNPAHAPSRPAPTSGPAPGQYSAASSGAPSVPRPAKSGAALWLWGAAAVVAIVLGGLLAVIVLRSLSKSSPPPDAAPVAVVVVDAAPVVPDATPGPCPTDMLHAEPENEVAFCIDKYEAAAAGPADGDAGSTILPQVEISFADAEAKCVERGVRLCSSAEWISACRGTDGARYPYGKRFIREACNLSPSRRRSIEASGNYPECESAVGAFDMSGNVAEWTSEMFIQGGSAIDRSGGRCSKRYRGRTGKTYRDVGYRCCADPLAQD